MKVCIQLEIQDRYANPKHYVKMEKTVEIPDGVVFINWENEVRTEILTIVFDLKRNCCLTSIALDRPYSGTRNSTEMEIIVEKYLKAGWLKRN